MGTGLEDFHLNSSLVLIFLKTEQDWEWSQVSGPFLMLRSMYAVRKKNFAGGILGAKLDGGVYSHEWASSIGGQ